MFIFEIDSIKNLSETWIDKLFLYSFTLKIIYFLKSKLLG